jgi:hypothetical protein
MSIFNFLHRRQDDPSMFNFAVIKGTAYWLDGTGIRYFSHRTMKEAELLASDHPDYFQIAYILAMISGGIRVRPAPSGSPFDSRIGMN